MLELEGSGTDTYKFRARLLLTGTIAASGWSPLAKLTVS